MPYLSHCPPSRKLKSLATDQQPNNQPEESENAREDFNDQDFDEESRIRSVGESSAAAIDPDTNTTDEIAHANGHT